jgi:hypothetical protein
MKVHYQIKSEETGTILIKQRKIAKALRWWLRKNKYSFQYTFFVI